MKLQGHYCTSLIVVSFMMSSCDVIIIQIQEYHLNEHGVCQYSVKVIKAYLFRFQRCADKSNLWVGNFTTPFCLRHRKVSYGYDETCGPPVTRCACTLCLKKCSNMLLSICSSNIERFPKFFYWQTLWTSSSSVVIKHPTTFKLRCYTTM